jgi:hypothetical protein
MHREFQLVLERVLRARGVEKLAFDVTDCPHPDAGEISSNLPLLLAKQIGGDPLTLAQEIIAALPPDCGFEVQSGGPGFLNASAALGFIPRFFTVVSESPLLLFGQASVFERIAPQIDPWPVRWKEKPLRLLLDGNDEAAALRKQRDFSSQDDQLMLLAVCADSELSAAAYLSGLHGRENIPWYLARLESDVQRHLSAVENVPLREEMTKIGLSRCLLGFRRNYLLARTLKRPEMFFAAIVSIARNFYVEFNRPDVRAGRRDSGITLLAGISGQVVKAGLSMFRFEERP